jgi:hypothetical protein
MSFIDVHERYITISVKRFNSLSIESQLNNEIIAPLDIGGLNAMNHTGFQRRVLIAKFALLKSNTIRSISANFNSVYKDNWQKLFTKNMIRNSIKVKKIEIEHKDEVNEEKEVKEGVKPVDATDTSSPQGEKDLNEALPKSDEQQTKENNNQNEPNTATNAQKDENEVEDKSNLESQIMNSLISLLMQVSFVHFLKVFFLFIKV